jgi:hypothetical protein
MKTELYIKKNGKDSFDLRIGSAVWEKVSALQVYSWIYVEFMRTIPVGTIGRGNYKITIEELE